MAKKEIPEKELSGDELSFRKRNVQNSVRRGGFRGGDIVLVLLAVAVTAVMIFLGTRVIPAIRENFSSYHEEVRMTVEYPVTLTDMLPQAGDAWTLLDADGAICTVREVDYSEEEGICRVTLLRKDAVYRDGEGYTIENIRIAVGSKLYFRGVSDRYFAVTVLTMDSDRFALQTETEMNEAEETEEPLAEETDAAANAPDGEEVPDV